MRILVAVDQNPYSAHAVRQVAGLAMNTWADITLLGLQPKKRTGASTSASISGRRKIDPALSKVMHCISRYVSQPFRRRGITLYAAEI